MFETLFKYPRVVARHRTGPAAEARERFLKHCAGQSVAGATLLRHARELLVIAERIDITRGEPIGWPAIEAAADCWAREQRDRHRVQALQGSRKLFVQTATTWLQFLGCLEEPQPKTVPFADRLADFAAYQRDERGLSPATIRGQGWQVEKFLSWLGEQNRPFDEVSLEEVDTFLANNGKRGWGLSRCLPVPKRCVLSFDMRPSADGVGPALPPALMARACSGTKGFPSARPGWTCSG